MRFSEIPLHEDEALVDFHTTESPASNAGAIPYSMIVRTDKPLWAQDLSAALEETLHRLVDAGATDDDIERICGMVPFGQAAQDRAEDGYTHIDLGYVLPGQILDVEEPADARRRQPGRSESWESLKSRARPPRVGDAPRTMPGGRPR